MKKTSVRILIICLTIITGINGAYGSMYAQNSNRKEAKKAKKEVENAMLIANFHAQDTVINMRGFVLEADYLQGRGGELVSVSKNINFIQVRGTQGTLQTGSNTAIGFNGLGGVTTEGNISNYKVKGNAKSLTHRVTFDLISNLGIFNIDMNIMANNTATATITSTTSMRLTWKGTLVAPFNSRVFKGQDTF